MSKKVAAVIVGTTGAVLAGVLGYAAYLNKRYDLDLEHLHDEDDYDDDEDFLFESDEPCEGEDLDNLFGAEENTDPFGTDTPEGFGFAPNNGSMADGVTDSLKGSMADGLKGSMADGMFAGDGFGCTPDFTAPVVPMSKESHELWQKFLQSRVKDSQNYMNTVKK